MNNIKWYESEHMLAINLYNKGTPIKYIARRLQRGYYSVFLELKNIGVLREDTKTNAYINNDIDLIKSIKKIVAHEFGVEEKDFILKDRKKWIAIPRQIAHSISIEYTDCSLEFIGMHIGGRTHATVLNSNRKISYERELSDSFNKLYLRTVQKVKNIERIDRDVEIMSLIKEIKQSTTDINVKISINQLVKMIYG